MLQSTGDKTLFVNAIRYLHRAATNTMAPTFKDLVDLVGAIAWPGVVLLLGLAFRREIRHLLNAVVERATKLSGLGVTVELAAHQVESERLSEETSPEEKAKALRDVEIARAVAPKFDYWKKKYRHPEGISDRDSLLSWLDADRGARYVSADYGVFKALAEVLAKMGYETLPPPSETEFRLKVADYEDRRGR